MSRKDRRKEEEGALLLLIMVGAAVMVIGIAVAAQAWSSTWRRDSEDELIFRGNQYVDAILAFQKEHGGTLPLTLDELMKLGPRRLRYIRKLYRDPVNPTGQWGLLYLMPGGQAIYDPVAAQKAQAESADADGGGGMSGTGMSRAGVTPISSFSGAMTAGMTPGATVPPSVLGQQGGPGGTMGPGQLPGQQPGNGRPGGNMAVPTSGVPGMGGAGAYGGVLPPPKPGTGTFDADSPSEPPIGWQIVGVISRVTGARNDRTFKSYKGHEKVNEWMFHIFDRGLPAAQAPGLPIPGGSRPPFMGPGFGNVGPLGGIGDGSGFPGGRGRTGTGRTGTAGDQGPGPGTGGKPRGGGNQGDN
jgi:hypothetical protein